MTLIEDVRGVQRSVTSLAQRVDEDRQVIDRHEQQVNGERGLSAAIDQLAKEVAGLRKAAYWIAGLIVTSSIGFAFSVLSLVH